MANLPIDKRFSDIDELGRAAGWSLDFKQLEAGPFRGSLSKFVGERSVLMDVRLAGVFHQQGAGPTASLTFGISTSGIRRWCGVEPTGDELLSFDHPQGFDGVSIRNHHGYTVSLSEDFWTEAVGDLDVDLETVRRLGYVRNSGVARARANLSALCGTLRAAPDGVSPRDLDRQLAETVIELLIETPASRQRGGISARAALRRRALEIIEERATDSVSVIALCRELGVSRATLDRAFRGHFGIGVKRYVISTRLRGVRRDLMTAHNGRRVADVANAWGFWHLGQFAKNYRHVYGELPSETLRRGLADKKNKEDAASTLVESKGSWRTGARMAAGIRGG